MVPEQISTAACGEAMRSRVFLKGTAAHGRAHTGADFPDGNSGPLRTHSRAYLFPEDLQPMGSIHTGAGEKCEREGVPEGNCYVMTISPPHPTLREG